jgi:N-acetylglucosaminyldiphosphoundecaprenol N-acetyl-beta-D-mannosaminyltransferase
MHGVMESQKDPELRKIINASDMNVPDGMPAVWVGRLAGFRRKQMDRVCGPDLMLEICERSARDGLTHFFYGGNEGVAELLAQRLAERFPGFKTVGCYTPPFRQLTPEEIDQVVRMVNEANPDYLWVGLSTPKQERWMSQFAPRLKVGVMLGVGAAFDFHTGKVARAPYWMQRSGLEWFYRVVKEPRRLYRRYLGNIPPFVALLGLQALRLRKYQIGT